MELIFLNEYKNCKQLFKDKYDDNKFKSKITFTN